jgi:Domain of unknown function (DUF4328)
MADILCPACKAELTLPFTPDGQTVECPRCRHDFVPFPETGAKPRTGRPPGPLRGEWKATFAMAMLAGSILTFVFQLYVNNERASLITQRENVEVFGAAIFGQLFDGPAAFDQRWHQWEDIARNMVTFNVLIFFMTVLAVLVWLYHVSSNLRLLQADGLSHSPAGAVLCYFAPFVNFIRPCSILQEICRASDPRAISTPKSWQLSPGLRSVALWWISFLGATSLGLICILANSDEALDPLDNQRIVLRLWSLSNLLMIVAGGFLIYVIHTLEQRQRERYARLYAHDGDA